MNIFAKSPTKLSSINLIYLGNVTNEVAPFRGISHLTEHLMAYAVRDLEAEYEKYGITSNACTGPTYVAFYLLGLDRYIKKFAEDFVQKIINFIPSKELFEREKKVVLEEYKDCFTDQISSYLLNRNRISYNYCGAIGYREDLMNITYEQFLEFHKAYFANPSKLVYIGKNPMDLNLNFSNANSDKDFIFTNKTDLKLEQENQFNEKTVIHLHTKLTKDELPYAKFASSLVSKGMDSPLFKVIREEHALAYFVHCGTPSFSTSFASMDIITQVSNENKKLTFDLLQNTMSNIDKHLTKKRFNDLKIAFKINLEKDNIDKYLNIGKFIVPYESTVDYLFDNKLLNYDYMIDFIKDKSSRFLHFSDKDNI